MEGKPVQEWTLDLPWGKLALVTWGDTSKKPALLVHGYMDSAATFTLLVEKLPDTHYYVAFDMPDFLLVSPHVTSKRPALLVQGYMDSAATFTLLVEKIPDTHYYVEFDTPGHGKSEPIPLGPLINQAHIVEVIKYVVDHHKWKRFVYISHSMGFIIGSMYNHVYPHRISRMINIDPGLAIAQLYFSDYIHVWYRHRYHMYYAETESDQWIHKPPKLYTREKAIQAVMRNRKLTEAQAEVIISRSLKPMGNGTYRLSWERNAKLVTTLPISAKTFYKIMTTYSAPTLALNASEDGTEEYRKGFVKDIFQKIRRKHPCHIDVTIEGGHDIHITNPEDCAIKIDQFINSQRHNLKAKL